MNQISTKDLAKKMTAGENVKIIDVREDFEVAMGKIPLAKRIPLGEIPNLLNELDKNDHYYIICASGGRSVSACQFLTQNGYHVTNIIGGMMAWEGEVE